MAKMSDQDDVKRDYRLYHEDGLSLRLKSPKRNKAVKLRQPSKLATAINDFWSMNFVADALLDNSKLLIPPVVDLSIDGSSWQST